MVTRGRSGETEREDDGWKTVRRSRNKGRPPTHRRPVDPRQDGRCFRCLARGHAAHSCREPIKCRLCRQGGYRQASCQLPMPPSTEPATTGLFACLVGELRDADPQWTHIIDGIQALCPELTDPDCHRLTAGDIFIRGLSKDAWRRIHGQTQHLDVRWFHFLATAPTYGRGFSLTEDDTQTGGPWGSLLPPHLAPLGAAHQTYQHSTEGSQQRTPCRGP